MSEDIFCEIDASSHQGLPLRFIDGHSEAQAHRKSTPCEGEVTIFRIACNAWYEYNLSIKLATNDGRFQKAAVVDVDNKESRTITQSPVWAQVAEQDNWDTFLQDEFVRRHSRWHECECVEILWRHTYLVVLIYDRISAVAYPRCSWYTL